jgi:23S rRNA A1618 N6-methylase RlmF
MCNPPFYASSLEMKQSLEIKSAPPSAVSSSITPCFFRFLISLTILKVCTGSENEMVTDGGEATFISKMIQESMKVQNQIRSVKLARRETLFAHREILGGSQVLSESFPP